jgi:hypothetical protein
MIASALLASRPDAATIIQGAAEAYGAQSPMFALPISAVTASLGEERAGNCAPAARAWTGTKPSPTPSPKPPRPSANPAPRPSHERAAASTDPPGARVSRGSGNAPDRLISAPSAIRTRDLLLRRHFHGVARRRWKSPDVASSCTGSGCLWRGVALCLRLLAPHLAPRNLVSRANVRAIERRIELEPISRQGRAIRAAT